MKHFIRVLFGLELTEAEKKVEENKKLKTWLIESIAQAGNLRYEADKFMFGIIHKYCDDCNRFVTGKDICVGRNCKILPPVKYDLFNEKYYNTFYKSQKEKQMSEPTMTKKEAIEKVAKVCGVPVSVMGHGGVIDVLETLGLIKFKNERLSPREIISRQIPAFGVSYRVSHLPDMIMHALDLAEYKIVEKADDCSYDHSYNMDVQNIIANNSSSNTISALLKAGYKIVKK